jgi:kynurenine formamidase
MTAVSKPSSIVLVGMLLGVTGCSQPEQSADSNVPLQPTEIIDLGALVTEDLPDRMGWERYRGDRGWTRQNVFDVRRWQAGPVNASNSYFTLFNHGGPHVDAPAHMGIDEGIDSYPIEAFTGPLRVFDVSHLSSGRTVTREFFEDQRIAPNDIVMIYTNYAPPASGEYPEVTTLTREAAEYLAEIPIRAFATDSFTVGLSPGDRPAIPPSELIDNIPVHHSFLSRGIPIYEQLLNVGQLLDKQRMLFVGVPLNIKDGDGMNVRPVVFVY